MEGSGRGEGGRDQRRLLRECQEIHPSNPSEAGAQESAGALKLKPAPEHDS